MKNSELSYIDYSSKTQRIRNICNFFKAGMSNGVKKIEKTYSFIQQNIFLITKRDE